MGDGPSRGLGRRSGLGVAGEIMSLKPSSPQRGTYACCRLLGRWGEQGMYWMLIISMCGGLYVISQHLMAIIHIFSPYWTMGPLKAGTAS